MGLFRLFDKFVMAPTPENQGDFKSYVKALEEGLFDEHLCFGIAQDKRGFLLTYPFNDPGALYCGGMGSGKSQGMKFTIVTHYLANSHKTFYIFFDAVKAMQDYRVFFAPEDKGGLELPNVAAALMDDSKIVNVIEMLDAEVVARKIEFEKVGAANVIEYEEKMRKKDSSFTNIARIVLAVEEFHTIPNSDQVKYSFKSETPNTTANKLKMLLKVGRSYGITLLAASQRATSDDFPTSLKVGIAMMLAFRVSTPNDVNFMGLPQAADISTGENGRCVYSKGYVQFPYMKDEVIKELIKTYAKPFNAKLLKYQSEDYHKAFEGEGNDGMVWVISFKDAITNYQSYKFSTIASKFLKAFDFKVTPQNNEALIAQLIAERDGKKYAVFCIAGRVSGVDKMIKNLKSNLSILGVDSTIIIGAEQLSGSIGQVLGDAIVVDGDDLSLIAKTLDNKEELELKGYYQELYNKLPLASKPKKVEAPTSDDNSEDDDAEKDLDAILAQMKDKVIK